MNVLPIRAAAALVAAGLALVAQPAAAAPPQNLASAIMVEWTLANCRADRVPAILVAMSGMVIDATPKEEAERMRVAMREGVKENYPNVEAACAEMLGLIAQANP